MTELDIGSANIRCKELASPNPLCCMATNQTWDCMLQELELLNLGLNRITDAGVKGLAESPMRLQKMLAKLQKSQMAHARVAELAKLQMPWNCFGHTA